MTDLSMEMLKAVAVTRAMAGVVSSPRYIDSHFETYVPATPKQAKALAAARKFTKLMPWLDSDSAANLWLIGSPGTGKTHLAVAVLRNAVADDIENGDKSVHRFVSHVELMREWKAASAKRGSDAAFFSRYSEQGQILALDDIRAPRSTDEAEALDWLIELRYRQHCCPTIVTTNLNLKGLQEALGDRSFDRLREGALMAVLDGASHRARFAWDGPPQEDAE